MVIVSRLKKNELNDLGFTGSVVQMKTKLKRVLKTRNLSGRNWTFKQLKRNVLFLKSYNIEKSKEKTQLKKQKNQEKQVKFGKVKKILTSFYKKNPKKNYSVNFRLNFSVSDRNRWERRTMPINNIRFPTERNIIRYITRSNQLYRQNELGIKIMETSKFFKLILEMYIYRRILDWN